MPPLSATATAGSMALHATRGAHPATRLDTFLRHTDASYQPAEAPTQGDRFIRKMATYGQVRPSVSFTSEPRVTRPHKEHTAVDMSRLPPPWMDPRGDEREGTFEVQAPPEKADDSFLKLLRNQSLMLPSERYKEHLQIKAAKEQFDKDREAIFRYRKRMNVLERHYPNGIVGLDGPMHPGTKLYAERQAHLVASAEEGAQHAERRFDHLARQRRADDAAACRGYGSDPELSRSQDVGMQRKRVDPGEHPHRFLNTHDRLFPKHVPTWDPSRAAALRSHEVRGKQHNIISGCDNSVTFKVAA